MSIQLVPDREVPTKCPECQSILISRSTGRARPSSPPQHQRQMWCGEHGFVGEKYWLRQRTEEEIARIQWEVANQKKKGLFR